MRLIQCRHLRLLTDRGMFAASPSVACMFLVKRYMASNLFRPSSEVVDLTTVEEKDSDLAKPSDKSSLMKAPKRTFDWLARDCSDLPCFKLDADQIEVIYEPVMFYQRLLELAAKSKRRITISSLYFGTQTTKERDLIRTIYKTFNNEPQLKLTFLVDCTRGTRREDAKSESSLDLLKRFMIQVDEHHKTEPPASDRCSFNFFLSTRFASAWRRLFILPRPRLNETIAVHHIKCYIFDDTVILSGANLSEQYFTNRQDRYIVFKDASQLADYYDELIAIMSRFSLQIDREQVHKEKKFVEDEKSKEKKLVLPRDENVLRQIFTLKSHSDWSYHPLSFFSRFQFRKEARNLVNDLNRRWKDRLGNLNSSIAPHSITGDPTLDLTSEELSDSLEHPPLSPQPPRQDHQLREPEPERTREPVYIVPIHQMREFGIRNDERFTMSLLFGPPAMEFKLVSGYFNLIPEYQNLLIQKATRLGKGCSVELLYAHEEANGFWGANGLRGFIPRIYTYYAWDFVRRIIHKKADNGINVWSWKKPEWTFHAKGLWIDNIHDDDCVSTDYMFATIGSPNFGYRSVYCDIESQVAMITADKQLRIALEAEYRRLWHNAIYVEPKLEDNPLLPPTPTYVTWFADLFKKHF